MKTRPNPDAKPNPITNPNRGLNLNTNFNANPNPNPNPDPNPHRVVLAAVVSVMAEVVWSVSVLDSVEEGSSIQCETRNSFMVESTDAVANI